MNKFFAKLAGALSLVALVAGAGVALASGVNAKGVKAAEAVYAEAIFIADNQPGNSSYTGSFENTTSGFVWTVTNFNNNNNGWAGAIKCGRKNNASVATITTKSTVSEAITKASINITALTASKVNSIKLYADGSVVGTFTVGSGTKEVEIPVASRGANKVYKFEFDCASGSSNGLVTIDSVKLYYDAATGNPEISLSPNQLSFLSNGASQNVTVTPNDKFTGTPTISVSGTPSYVNCSVSGLTISVSPKAVGTETVTINAVHNTEQASATLSIEVLDKHGRVADDPFSVAEVTALIDADTSKVHTGVYVSGIISQVDSYNSTYHSITYWISDDGTTTGQFECYSGKGIGSADFSAVTDVEVGAQVEVCGDAKYYSGKEESFHEFDKNNYLISYKGPTTSPLDSISLDTSSVQKTFDVGDEFNHDNLVVTAHYEDESSRPVSPTSVSAPDMSSAGEKTVTVSYTENEVTKFETYSITVNAVVLHTISFVSGGGGGTMSPVQVKDGTYYNLPACEFTAPDEDQVFDAWVYFGTRMTHIESVDRDYEFTALWKDKPATETVTYDFSSAIPEEWVASMDKTTTDTTLGRGVGWGADKGTITLTLSNSVNVYSVVVVASTNNAGNTVAVSVGGTSYGDPQEIASGTDHKNEEYKFEGSSSGNIVVTLEDTTKTVWVLSITVTADAPAPKTLSSISISNEKTEYTVGEEFVMPTVTAHYEDAPDDDVTSKATQSGFDSSAIATGQEVTISYIEGGVTKDASYFVNINAPEPVETKTYKKVKTNLANFSEDYLIVYEGDGTHNPFALNSKLTKFDATENGVAVEIANEKISLSNEYEFTVAKKEGGYSIKSTSNLYIGQTTYANSISEDSTDKYTNQFSYVEGNAVIQGEGNSADDYVVLRYNNTSGQNRFRFMKNSGVQAIALYIEVENDAEALALDILNLTSEVCVAGGEHTSEDFKEAWKTLSTAFSHLGDEKSVLVEGSADANGTFVAEALARYDLLVRKYGLDNFIERSIPSGLNTSIINNSVDSNSAMIIITVIALTSISSIAVLLVIKRRKAIK